MDYTELFDRYIDGRLDGKELEDFKRKLNMDADLKKNLKEYINLHNIAEEIMVGDNKEDLEMKVDKETDQFSIQDIDKYGREKRGFPDKDMSSFRKNITLAEKGYLNGEIGGMKRNLLVSLAVAATVIVVVVITVFFYVWQNRITNSNLFTEYYKPYVKSEKIFEIARSSDTFDFAVNVFESGDYIRASLLFIQYTDSSELEGYASLYAGLTFIQMGKWEDALVSLKKAVKSDDIQMTNVARWYLGLCLLRMDDGDSAREQFKILASSKNEYTVRSRRILRKIR